MLFFQQKNVSFAFYLSLYISDALFLVELRWPAAYFLFFSVFLLLYIPNLWTFYLENMDTATISAFVFIDSLVVSASQDAGSYATSRQNNLELHLGFHTCWLSYFTLVCLWCGRMVGRSVGRCTVTSLPNLLEWVVNHIFLPMVLRCACFSREGSAKIYYCKFLNVLTIITIITVQQERGLLSHRF